MEMILFFPYFMVYLLYNLLCFQEDVKKKRKKEMYNTRVCAKFP